MAPKIWLLKLILPGRFGWHLTGPVYFALLYSVFYLLQRYAGSAFATTFFCAITAYTMPAYAYICEYSRKAMADLAPELEMSQDELSAFIESLDHQSIAWQVMVLAWGILGGLGQIWLVSLEPDTAHMSAVQLALSTASLGSLLVWIVMTTAIFSLMQNAVRVGRLANQLKRVDLFRHDKLLPFARVGIASSLSILGALALFPILLVDDRSTLVSSAPGLIATGVPLILMLIFPVWRVHRRMKLAKQVAMAEVNQSIDEVRSAQGEPTLATLNTLLSYRKHLKQVPEWPLDTGAVGRLLLYILIVPMTWVGAALIENVVDALL
ncbi:hypothetical protein [Parahalioglobus pacificus]|uniref:Uncharacterized protein n=1 Tax=Parahalioglobus pacificus TaxID=930806 RepID=A0A918XKW4_9GAMM|nr:hypothetical protein [Halioglobus pacificus]GHD37055.1 hypothetical protein GCM10007053_26180 [Halioglobus pacificus]